MRLSLSVPARTRRRRSAVAAPVLLAPVLLALVALALAGLTACSGSSGSDNDAGHNDADVAFTTAMIGHHRQAIDMSAMVPTRGSDPRVRELATQIAAAQGPEIEQMADRLRAWGESVPTGTDHHSAGHSGTHDPMAGMMSETDMSTLASLNGAAFDRRWLTMMIEHHSGAVDMARTQIAEGADAESTALARQIIDAQQREIEQMRGILAG